MWKPCGLDCKESHAGEGFIQRYVHYTREFEAPASYHVFALLTAVAAATNRKIVISRGGYKLWPNVYVLLHGPSGLGKGIASGNAVDFVRAAAGPQLVEFPEDLTGEGLFKILDADATNGCGSKGLIYADEFADLLGGQDYKKEFAKRLTRIYSSPDRLGVGRSATGALWASDLFINILGCSQEDWLRELPLHAIKGGLFARFMMAVETAARHRKFEPRIDMKVGKKMIQELAGQLGLLPTAGGEAILAPDAKKFAEDWYMKEDARRKGLHEIVRPWCERRTDHAIKLAFLRGLLEGNDPLTISLDDMKWGIDVIEWMTPRIQEAFLKMDESQDGKIHRMIVEILQNNGGSLRERSVRSGLSHQYGKRQLDPAIRHLVEIRRVQQKVADDGSLWLSLRSDSSEQSSAPRLLAAGEE